MERAVSNEWNTCSEYKRKGNGQKGMGVRHPPWLRGSRTRALGQRWQAMMVGLGPGIVAKAETERQIADRDILLEARPDP